MRDGASRVFGYAILASLLLHALLLFALPAARELSALMPPEAPPLIARVEQLAPPPPPAPVGEARKPAPPLPAPVAKPAPEPLPIVQAPAPRPAPAVPGPVPAPAAAPAPAPAPVARAAPEASAALTRAPPPVDPAIRSDYARRINEAAERFKVYPRVAIDNNWRGEVALVMVVASDGRIASLRISRSSGHKVLDDQALEMFERAAPRVRMPPELRGREFELDLRAVFRLDS